MVHNDFLHLFFLAPIAAVACLHGEAAGLAQLGRTKGATRWLSLALAGLGTTSV